MRSIRVRPGVQYGLPATRGMSQRQARRLYEFACRASERRRQPGQHRRGPLTFGGRQTLKALLSFSNRQTGSCFPSVRALAQRAGVAKSTAEIALAVLEGLGVIEVFRRIVRRGQRILRTSNAYRFRDMGECPDFPEQNPNAKESVGTYQPETAENGVRVVVRYEVLDRGKSYEDALARLGAAGNFLNP